MKQVFEAQLRQPNRAPKATLVPSGYEDGVGSAIVTGVVPALCWESSDHETIDLRISDWLACGWELQRVEGAAHRNYPDVVTLEYIPDYEHPSSVFLPVQPNVPIADPKELFLKAHQPPTTEGSDK